MSQGLLDSQNGAQPPKGGISRRTFLKFGITVGAATGGGATMGAGATRAGGGTAA